MNIDPKKYAERARRIDAEFDRQFDSVLVKWAKLKYSGWLAVGVGLGLLGLGAFIGTTL